MRILFLAQRVPWPPNRGDKITTWRLLERMGRSHRVECVAFAHGEDDLRAARELGERGFPTLAVPLRPRLAKLRSLPLLLGDAPLTLGFYGSRRLQEAVDRRAAGADLAYAFSSSMGAFLEPHAELPRVMHFAELDSDKWRQYAERAPFPMSRIYRREHRTLLAFERRIAHAFSESVLCTPVEEAIFRREIPGASSMVLRNGVDLAHFRPRPELSEPGHIVFTGVMDYFPNVDGCVHFVREVLPRVRARHPGARFTIVGSRPVGAIRRLARVEGVEVTGFVAHTRDWLARAAVSVAPLRIARGIQNKVLEALAMGLPVVGTRAATQGVEGEPGRHYIVADGAGDTARAIADILDDPASGRELGERGRALVEERYDWERVLNRLDALLERLMKS